MDPVQISKDKCDDERQRAIPAEYIRINASKSQIEQRIAAFFAWKRCESDVANVQEFCHHVDDHVDDHVDSCARTQSVLIARKGGKSHLKVSKVVNKCGPQTERCIPAVLDQRLENMERHVGVHDDNRPVGVDVYARLKQLEDRLLYLESHSPEYFDADCCSSRRMDETQVMDDTDRRIAELRRKLS